MPRTRGPATTGESGRAAENGAGRKSAGRAKAAPSGQPRGRRPRSEPRAAATVPIVGLGASAGGLEPLREFFGLMPEGSGLAFVVIQHLDPHHESMLVDLLARCTRMTVEQAAEGAVVEAGHVYVIPPNASLTVERGVLHLAGPVGRRGVRMPIDQFFRSLAADQGPRSIGIILSGTASEGPQGLREIKAQGGMAMVQDPETAQHDGMPRNALATGLVDYVLPVKEMPEVLLRYVGHSYFREGTGGGEAPPAGDDLVSVLSLLRARTGHDFRGYKHSTLLRRIHRRMGLHQVERVPEYLEIVRRDPAEAEALFRDLLVKVTSFFREPEAWGVLARDVLPEIVSAADEGNVRAWVPACSTGMEAYSLAILLAEEIERQKARCAVQIFATDIDQEALDQARRGVYAPDVAADVSADRLQRFFGRHGDSYQVSQRIRDMVVFAPQNLLGDPPFSRLDLVTCRNLLIYIDPEVQRKLLPMFHFALRDGGYLFLGSSESLGRSDEGFETVSKKWRIYRNVERGRGTVPTLPPLLGRSVHPAMAGHASRRGFAVGELANRVLAEHFAPAALLVDDRYQVVYFHGDTDPYLRHPVGEPTRDLVSLLREAIRGRVRGAVYHAIANDQPVVVRVKVPGEKGPRQAEASAVPLHDHRGAEGLVLLTFDLLDRPAEVEPLEPSPVEEEVVRQLELELKSTREELQSTIEELETSNEELKASNEEVMSINEELQSSNEELEASKEELQSINEELSTVNAQLHEKVVELETANNDLSNLLSSTAVATVFLDESLRIRRFTPVTAELLNLIPGDVGRPLSDIASGLNDPGLRKEAREVLQKLAPVEREIALGDGRWFIRRVLPFRTHDNRIGGVVVTFTDVTRIKHSEAEQVRLAAIVDTSSDAIISRDLEGRVTTWNHGAEATFGFTASEMVGSAVERLIPAEDREAHGRRVARVAGGEALRAEERRRRRDGALIDVELSLAPVLGPDGAVAGVSTIARDVTEARRVSRDLAESEARYRATGELVPFGSWMCDASGACTFLTQPFLEATGRTMEEVRGFGWLDLVPEEQRGPLQDAWMHCVQTGEDWDYEYDFRGADGAMRTTVTKGRAVRDSEGGILFWAGFHLDVTDRRRLEEDLLELNRELEERVEARTAQLRALAVELSRAEQRERTELARVLHDGLQQLLAAGHLHVEAARASGDEASVRAVLEKLDALLDEALQASQNLVAELAPPVIQRASLSAALRWLAERLSDRLHVDVETGDGEDISRLTLEQRRLVFRVVRELLLNVIKHAGAGEAKVRVEEAGDTLEVSVSDEGCGFDPAVLDRGPAESFGLLSVREQLHAAGGDLVIESAPGHGVLAVLSIPLGLANEVRAAAEAMPPHGMSRRRRRRSSIGVLLVDDDRALRESLAAVLSGEPGIDVVGEAETGEEALWRARELDPDVVIMDVSMPRMDGVEATRELKAVSPLLTVIALSMHDDASVRAEMIAAGAAAFFVKGKSSAGLVEAIRAVRGSR